MTKVNLLAVFKTFKGEPMRLTDPNPTLMKVLSLTDSFFNEKIGKEDLQKQITEAVHLNPPLTLREVCINALQQGNPQDRMTGVEKFRRGRLAQMVADADEIELPAEDITLMKKAIDELYPSPLIYYNAVLYLDPPAEDRKPS
jgi:hypothetical protein